MNDVILCPGFKAAAVAAGIKKKAGLDLGLIYADHPVAAAGVFTRNLVQAAPVVLSRQRTETGWAQAVIVNAGNANCCTGTQGMETALAMSAAVAAGLGIDPELVLVGSTGVIGQPLPVEKVAAAVPGLVGALQPDGFDAFACAIMTTDTVPKLVRRQVQLEGRTVTLVAAAKGAGMIRPDMATMLCFICSDVSTDAAVLAPMLKSAVDRSLNCITIDGDTSTNDTVLLLAGGESGVTLQAVETRRRFQAALDDLLYDVARRLVKDGEGVTKVVEIKVRGAQSDAAALRIADTVAHSPLVKTAFFGEDANWGRILAAAGRAGVAFDLQAVDIFFDGVQMVAGGLGLGAAAEKEVTTVLKQPEFSVTIDLGQGAGAASILTCDFSVDYVKINADYRS